MYSCTHAVMGRASTAADAGGWRNSLEAMEVPDRTGRPRPEVSSLHGRSNTRRMPGVPGDRRARARMWWIGQGRREARGAVRAAGQDVRRWSEVREADRGVDRGMQG